MHIQTEIVAAHGVVVTSVVLFGGHFCGGEWKIPGLGAFHIPSRLSARYGWFPDDARVCGLYSLEDVKVYITRGLSTNGDVLMPFRVNNRPEISLLTFQSTSRGSMLD